MAGMRAGQQQQAAAAAASTSTPEKTGGGSPNATAAAAAAKRDVEIAVERVARELHAAYKTKHETKVAALKKSYEARWEKRVYELEARATELVEDNERLRMGRDATMTRVVPDTVDADGEERRAQAARSAAQISELGAEVRKLEAVVQTVQADNNELRVLLERERVEKGELVLLAEEMMSMQTFVGSGPPSSSTARMAVEDSRATGTVTSVVVAATAAAPVGERRAPENLRSSVSRSSGLKPPTNGGSKIGRPGATAHERKQSAGPGAGGGLPRPGSGMALRSGIMNSIEKMGNYRGGRAE